MKLLISRYMPFPTYFFNITMLSTYAIKSSKYRPLFFDQVGHQTTYAFKGNRHMSSSDLPKSWTELTKI